jgi:hypothetical protein
MTIGRPYQQRTRSRNDNALGGRILVGISANRENNEHLFPDSYLLKLVYCYFPSAMGTPTSSSISDVDRCFIIKNLLDSVFNKFLYAYAAGIFEHTQGLSSIC